MPNSSSCRYTHAAHHFLPNHKTQDNAKGGTDLVAVHAQLPRHHAEEIAPGNVPRGKHPQRLAGIAHGKVHVRDGALLDRAHLRTAHDVRAAEAEGAVPHLHSSDTTTHPLNKAYRLSN